MVPEQVRVMMERNDRNVIVERITKGGYSLENHWYEDQAINRLSGDEKWDYVVLQNHSLSAINHRDSFDEYGTKFIELVQKNGATPILYMTWARRNKPEMQEVISEAYNSLGEIEGVRVAPVGEAFAEWIEEHPFLSLHIADNSHTTMEGSYLAACVIYSTITGENAIGLPNKIKGENWITGGDYLAYIDPKVAEMLQETAWRTCEKHIELTSE